MAISQDPAGSWGSYRRMRWPYAAGRRGRRPLQGVCARRACPEICNGHRRSLSAATDAIGACHFNGGRYESPVRSRERRAAPLQWRVHASGAAPNLRAVHGASGTPHPTTRHRYFNNTPKKCSLSFLRLHFFIGRIGENARFQRAPSAPGETGRRGQKSADASVRSRPDVALSDNLWAKCTKSGEIS